MKYLFTILLLVCILKPSSSQQKINISSEKDSNGNYKFYCTNDNYCDYTLEIRFTELKNLKSDGLNPFKTELRPGKNYLFTLEIIDKERKTSLNYTGLSKKGIIDPEVDFDYSYLLPYADGKTTKAMDVDPVNITPNLCKTDDFYVIGFELNEGDTIYASRRGIVSSVKDDAQLSLSDYTYTSDDNFVEIYHNDCTFGRYAVIKNSLVEIGQEVEAGDPIAIAGGEKYVVGTHMKFFVYYNHEKDDEETDVISSSTTRAAYVPIKFYTIDGETLQLETGIEYTSTHPYDIITKEMTKRQLKNWTKKNKK